MSTDSGFDISGKMSQSLKYLNSDLQTSTPRGRTNFWMNSRVNIYTVWHGELAQ